MPCYDHRDHDTSYIREAAMNEFRHNSHVAQMLCTALRALEVEGYPLDSDMRQWLREHKARDAAKAKKEQEEKEYKLKQAQERLEKAKRDLEKLIKRK
jgi:hypothetical protein